MAKVVIGGGFTSIPNEMILDKDLSDKALRLWTYIAMKPDDWNFFDKNMSDELGASSKTIQRSRKELSDAGYLGVFEKQTQNGSFNGFDYYLYTSRTAEKVEHVEIETANGVDKNVHRGVDKNDHPPLDKNVHHTNKDITNKDNIVRITSSQVSMQDIEINSKDSQKYQEETYKQAFEISKKLLAYLEEHIPAWKYKTPNQFREWVYEIEKAIRIDGFQFSEIMDVLTWIFEESDGFWIPNIQSGGKLRKQLPRLVVQMRQSKGRTPKKPNHYEIKQYLVNKFGYGVPFLIVNNERTGLKNKICLWKSGEYPVLYNYSTSRPLGKEAEESIMKLIEDKYEQLEVVR